MKYLSFPFIALLGLVVLTHPISLSAVNYNYYEVNERLLKPYCVACHSSGTFQPDLSTYKGVVDHLKAVETAVFSKSTMPPGEELYPQLLEMLKQWIRDGAPEGKPVRYEDVREAVFKPFCVSCHAKGIGNLVELDSYSSVKKNIQAVFAVSVGSDIMPPSPEVGKSHALSFEQKKLLRDWVRFGLLE